MTGFFKGEFKINSEKFMQIAGKKLTQSFVPFLNTLIKTCVCKPDSKTEKGSRLTSINIYHEWKIISNAILFKIYITMRHPQP